MKRLFIIGFCVAVALAAPRPDDDDDNDNGPQHGRRFHNQPQEFDDDDQQQQQNRRRLQSLSLKLIDDGDVDNKRGDRIQSPDDEIDDDDDDLLTNKNLDVLTRELDHLTSKYKGRGVLKVAYNPPVVRNVPGARVHNLGNLNFKYYTPREVGNRWQNHRDLVPLPISAIKSPFHSIKTKSKSKPTVDSKNMNNGYVLWEDLDPTDLRDGDDDDSDDHKY